jgi:cytochrome bd-I ubiquinol oxidase subunit X
MWYFSWILGTGLALTFGVLNAMWYELMDQRPPQRDSARDRSSGPS